MLHIIMLKIFPRKKRCKRDPFLVYLCTTVTVSKYLRLLRKRSLPLSKSYIVQFFGVTRNWWGMLKLMTLSDYPRYTSSNFFHSNASIEQEILIQLFSHLTNKKFMLVHYATTSSLKSLGQR